MCSSSCFGGLCYVDAFVHLLLLCSFFFVLVEEYTFSLVG